jgi:LmbE family N-acetylglucosaminyl deacetylase
MKSPVALVVAAHPDDEVLGCGGTILKLRQRGFVVNVAFMTDGESSRRSADLASRIASRRQAAVRASAMLGTEIVQWGDFPDNAMDTVPLIEVVRQVESAVLSTSPSVVMTHWHGDLNIDHQIVARAVVTATRPQSSSTVDRVLAFEIPSSTEWAFGLPTPFTPNTFVVIDDVFEPKMAALDCYGAELREGPHPRSRDSITASARRHGHAVGCSYAEALVLIRAVE